MSQSPHGGDGECDQRCCCGVPTHLFLGLAYAKEGKREAGVEADVDASGEGDEAASNPADGLI